MGKVLYEVYDGETKVFEGDREAVLNKFELNPKGSLSSFINRGILLKKKYKVVKTDRNLDYISNQEVISESKLDYLVEHLSRYGNTVMLQDPTPYLKDLKKLGFDVNVTKFNLDTSNALVLNDNSYHDYKKQGKNKESVVISHYIEVI